MARSNPVDSISLAVQDEYFRGFAEFQEITAPSTPGADRGRLYAKDNGGTTDLYWMDPTGTQALLTPGAGPAPLDAQYLTLAVNGTLTVERVFTPGTALSGADAGAGSTYTLNHAQVAVGDLHQDYLLVAGTRAMTGGLAMGASGITNALSLTGIAAATSLTIASHVTAGAAAQRDILFRTGDATNPQALATRLTLASNLAAGSGTATFDGSIIAGTTPASAGILRVPNNTNISWRNAANDGDVTLAVNTENELSLSSGRFQFGDAAATPDAVGEFYRSGAALYWHDGTNAINLDQQMGIITLFVDGTVAVGTKQKNYNFAAPLAGTILSARAVCNTAPTGAAILIDINEDGTTIFSSTKLTIAISATSGTQTGVQNVAFAAGALFTFDLDQVGSTIAGADLLIELIVVFTRTN